MMFYNTFQNVCYNRKLNPYTIFIVGRAGVYVLPIRILVNFQYCLWFEDLVLPDKFCEIYV